jgi:hypothetical protein
MKVRGFAPRQGGCAAKRYFMHLHLSGDLA